MSNTDASTILLAPALQDAHVPGMRAYEALVAEAEADHTRPSGRARRVNS